MKHIGFLRPSSFVAAVALALGLSSCVIGVETSGSGASTSAVPAVEVQLRVDAAGAEVSLQRVEYQVGGTSRTVDTSALPWAATVRASPGDSIYLNVAASAARGGTVTISYEALRDGRVVARGSRACDQVGCPGLELRGQIPR